MGFFYQSASRGELSGLGHSIEDFIFADDVRSQLGSLSVKSFNREGAKRGAGEHYHCDSKFRSHGKVPPLATQLNNCLARATVP
jgi:hypothetical protein